MTLPSGVSWFSNRRIEKVLQQGNTKVESGRLEALVGNLMETEKTALEASRMFVHWEILGNAALALALTGDTAAVQKLPKSVHLCSMPAARYSLDYDGHAQVIINTYGANGDHELCKR